MIRLASFICIVFLLIPLAACKKQTPSPLTTTTQPSAEKRELPPPGPKIDACTLLNKDEVGAIQGAAMIEPIPSEGGQGEFFMSQCYYGSSEPNKSVSLALIQRTAQYPGNRMVRDFWRDTFDKASKPRERDEEERGEGRREEKGENEKRSAGSGTAEREEHEGPAPQKIEGVGEEAYWIANPVGGILYVLESDRMLRISVGGPDNADKKLEKSKQLAQKALTRLPR